MRFVNEIVVHATATRPEWWRGKSTKAQVAEVRRWHMGKNPPWSDIGYHFLIGRDGTVVVGRPITKTPASVRGHNTGTIAIALFGGFGGAATDNFEDHFTPEQGAALFQATTNTQTRLARVLPFTRGC